MQNKSFSTRLKFLDFLLFLSGFKLYSTGSKITRWFNLCFRLVNMSFNYMELVASCAILTERGLWFHWFVLIPRSLVPIIAHHYFWFKLTKIRETVESLENFGIIGNELRKWTAVGFVAWSVGVIVSFVGLVMDVVKFDLSPGNDYQTMHRIVTGFLAPFYSIYRNGWLLVVLLFYLFIYYCIHEINNQLFADFGTRYASSLERRSEFVKGLSHSRSKLQLVKREVNQHLGLFPFLLLVQLFLDSSARLVSGLYPFRQPINGFAGDYLILCIAIIATILFLDNMWREESKSMDQMIYDLRVNFDQLRDAEDRKLLVTEICGSPVIPPECLNSFPLTRDLFFKFIFLVLPFSVIVINLLPVPQFDLAFG